MTAGLVGAAAASGALGGFAAGAAWTAAGLPAATPLVVAALAAAALVADAAGLRPLAVGRQVPQAWGRLLSPAAAATLYGARLGVGPLTILPTWLWWATFVAGSTLGPWVAAAAGVAFGGARGLAMVAAGRWARPAMALRMASLRRAEPAAGLAVAGAVLLLAVAGVV